MNSLFIKILEQKEFFSNPPVLVDVGASGGLPVQWRVIAPYSICIAFDADTRDFCISEASGEKYKKLYTFNRLVASKSVDDVEFFLTKSPHCSSSLRPNHLALNEWAFCALFDVQETVKMSSVDLMSALSNIKIEYIDWFKSDSQGTDLRIFSSLSKKIIDRMLACDFEPGIINAYYSEDKLHALMNYMEDNPFWVTSMIIKGSQRIKPDLLQTLNSVQRHKIDSFLKMAPGWCEISYLNNFKMDNLGEREYMLGWIFSSINKEHGFALQLATDGLSIFENSLFDEMILASRKALSKGYCRVCYQELRKLTDMLLRFFK